MINDSIDHIAGDFFTFLARRFPVCCSSDEFVFFPQALPERPDWAQWDDFSPDAVQDSVNSLRTFRNRIGKLSAGEDRPSCKGKENASLILWVIEVLEEQLLSVRHYVLQPTFILTLGVIGLVQALETRDPEALRDRVRTLPAFLERSRSVMGNVPDLYREMAGTMVPELSRWALSLARVTDAGKLLSAIESFARTLGSIPAAGDFRLDEDVLERVVRHHTGCGIDIRGCLEELEDEIRNTRMVLESESVRLGHGRDWELAVSRIPEDTIPNGRKKEFLMKEIGRLRDHCLEKGFPVGGTPGKASLEVEALPESLRTIRAADSYTAKPGFPFQGGVFYIFESSGLGRAGEGISSAYRLTTAHETYPGHHLLDMCRWNGPDPVRRPVEYPLFYEGWACFGEDLMYETGAFERDYDRLILARRRYRHAVRGKVDLLLHRGDFDLDAAAGVLCEAGFRKDRALDTVRKYALRPAYQMCYTIGRRRFQALFDSHGRKGAGHFARTVLNGGEILFGDLEKVFSRMGNDDG